MSTVLSVAQDGLWDNFFEYVYAATGIVRPSGDGGQNDATPDTCGGTNASCLDEVVTYPTDPSTTGDFLTHPNNGLDYFQMADNLTDVATATEITVYVYHIEGNANMGLYVSLWNAAESAQLTGTTEQLLPVITTADWGTTTFSGLSLSQSDIDGMRVRLNCTRPGGGKTSDCTSYAMYAEVTYDAVINVTVATSGNQQNLDVGQKNAYVGGMFYMTENTGSRDITSISIEETGSVNASADLSNVRLYYENATDCTAQSYNGTENQYGATTTFNGSNIATFSDTGIGITTGSELCVYVVLDVDETAAADQTIELQITDPSSDVVGGGGAVVEPNTPLTLAGTTVLQETVLTQTHYHWRDDNGDETDTGTGADSLTGGTDDTPYDTAAKQTTYRLRLQVDNEGNKTSDSTQYRIEYGTKVTNCSAVSAWTDVGAVGGDWDMSASQLVEGNDTTDISEAKGGMPNPGGSTFKTPNGGQRDTSSQTGAFTLTGTEFVELEYAIEAASGVVDGTTYCFRASSTSAHNMTYDVYPEITISSDLTMAANGSQVANVSIPTNNFYNGGQFAVQDLTAANTHNISAFTIAASGTVDLQNNIDQIRLYYEYDTTGPSYDCSGETYDGTELQFGATTTGGFTSTSSATFSTASTIIASSTQGVCFYVVYNIGSGATNGETIEIRMNNPSTDLVVNSGTISPTSLIDFTSFTTLQAPFVEQLHYHWRDNDGTELTAGSQTGSEDTPFSELPDSTVQRIRFGIANTGGGSSGNYQYQLEWAQRITTCDEVVSWTDIDTGGDDWSVVSSQLVDNTNTTDIATTTGGVTNVGTFLATNGGQQDIDGITGNIDLPASGWLELEYSVQAAATVSEGTPYCFRVTNNGTPLDNYDVYAEASIKLDTDFAVYRGVSTITGTSITITEGVDYDLQFNSSTRAFIRITNAHHTGGGPAAGSTGNHNATDVTAYISNPGNIATSITFTRNGAVNDTRVAWEIVEYIGDNGGENEFVVRSASTATYGTAATTVTTPTVTGIVNDNDVVPFVTGQLNPDGGRFDYNTGLSTSAWNSAGDTATFTRGEAGADASIVSYAIVEFTGANWKIQRVENTYTNTGTIETQPITAVNSLTRAFIHAQHRAGSGEDTHADFGHEVWISSIGQVSFRLSSGAQTAASHASVAWVIENTQSTGDRMIVQRKTGTIPAAGGGLTTANVTLDNEVDDFSVSSLFVNSRNEGTGRTYPEPLISAELISTTQFQLQVSDDGDANVYRAEVVEWPTAARKLVQNYYRLYVDNDAQTPTDPWPAGANDLGENAEMTANDGPIATGENIRIRMTLNVTAATMPGGVDSFQLQYGERISTCDAISDWKGLGEFGSTTALWRGNNATPTDGSQLSSTTISVSDVFGTYEEENLSALAPNTAFVGEDIEFDWNIENNGAKDKTSYCFRMTEADGTPLSSYSVNYPVIRTVGYGPEIGDWKWFDDELNLNPTSALAATNSAPIDIAFENIIKLRTVITEKAGAAGPDTKFKLQYSEYSDFSQAVFDVATTSVCTASSTWCYADGAGVDNATITSNVLGGVASCVGGVGDGCGTHNEDTATGTAAVDHKALTSAEFEFTIKHSGARANAVYYFRLWDLVNNEVVTASSSYPSLVTEGAQLVFAVSGVNAGETIDGEVIDVTTSTTSVSFGSIPLDTEYTAAYRLNVDTNATEGYKVLMLADQLLTNSYGQVIDSISGTNASPVGWGAGCDAAASSCFGYHVEDDLLEGGSARFSPNDSYAAISTTTPEEVMFSSVPSEDVHDIVFKTVIRETQEAGDYEANISFISIPIF